MSSYRPDEMSPSDRADIASWTEPDSADTECQLCGEVCPIDVDMEEAMGFTVCGKCVEDSL